MLCKSLIGIERLVFGVLLGTNVVRTYLDRAVSPCFAQHMAESRDFDTPCQHTAAHQEVANMPSRSVFRRRFFHNEAAYQTVVAKCVLRLYTVDAEPGAVDHLLHGRGRESPRRHIE